MRAVGFWWAPWSDRDPFPHPAHLVDPGWDPAERSTVLGYLQAGEPWREFLSKVSCAFCGLRVGNAYLSDGVWFWPEMLAHEVDRHAVRLPDEFVAAAAAGERMPVDPEAGTMDFAWWSQWARSRGACIDVDPGWQGVGGRWHELRRA